MAEPTSASAPPRPSPGQVFLVFLRLGLTAFGGPAMIPYIRRACVDRRGWLNPTQFSLGVAAAQVVPGATAMQVAAWAGLKARGLAGGMAAYLGFCLPAFGMMLGLSVLYFTSRDIAVVQAAFAGLKVVVAALVANAAVEFAREHVDSVRAAGLALAAGVWLGAGQNPILALVAVCALALVVFREIGPAPGDGGAEAAPVRPAQVVSLALSFCCWLGLLYVTVPALFSLAAMMAKIDLFAFGGGYVSLPLMLHEVVEARHLLTEAQFMDGIALGQVTPGPIVITATFVGYAVAGVVGAGVATIAVFSPSFLLLCGASTVAERLAVSPWARRALKGSLVSLVGLLGAVCWKFVVGIEWGWGQALLALAAFVALRLKVDVLWVVLVGAGVSMLLF